MAARAAGAAVAARCRQSRQLPPLTADISATASTTAAADRGIGCDGGAVVLDVPAAEVQAAARPGSARAAGAGQASGRAIAGLTAGAARAAGTAGRSRRSRAAGAAGAAGAAEAAVAAARQRCRRGRRHRRRPDCR